MTYKMQGGVKNYLGNQKMVKAPLHWQSSPDHPATELAYITKKEKNLLVKKDLHGSLKGGVNRGPSGIMSLNGWGDKDEGFADKSFGGNERPGRDVSVSTGSPHTEGPRTVTRTTKTVNTMPDVVDQKYSGDGFFSGYRNLDRYGQPKMGLAYAFDRVKNFLPGLITSAMGLPPIVTAARLGKKIFGADDEEEEEFKSDYTIGPDGQFMYTGSTDTIDDTKKEFAINNPLDLSEKTNQVDQVFNYKDVIPTMNLSESRNPNNFNVNQNYMTSGAEPNFEYPRSINQNMLTEQDYDYFNNTFQNGGIARLL
tara:strand:+ start:85 stop:1014 length:930 start_codon:yes stop_codon:yes gene_type:complete